MSKERRNEIKKKQKAKSLVPVIAIALTVVLIIGGVVALTVHRCDDCGITFVGSGYYKEKESAGVLGSLFGTVFGDTDGVQLEVEEDIIICEECAKNNVSVKAELRPLKDFKR